MSREYWTLKGESGETAFLAGVVDVLSDTLSLVCDFTSAFNADIFYIPGNDLALLDDTVKRRLNIYHRYQENSYVKQSDIDRIHFDLEKTEEDITEYVCHSFQKYSSSPKLKKAVKDFFQNLNWYLQKPLCIYRPCSQYPDKILNILGPVYLYMVFDYFFISYDEYMVLFIFGTTE